MLPSYNLPYTIKYIPAAPQVYYRWVTTGYYTCPKCKAMSGLTLPAEIWANGIHPGWHENCDCHLEPVYMAGVSMIPVLVYTPQPWLITDIMSGRFYDQVALMCTPYAIVPNPEFPNQGLYTFSEYNAWIAEHVIQHSYHKTAYNDPLKNLSGSHHQQTEAVHGELW